MEKCTGSASMAPPPSAPPSEMNVALRSYDPGDRCLMNSPRAAESAAPHQSCNTAVSYNRPPGAIGTPRHPSGGTQSDTPMSRGTAEPAPLVSTGVKAGYVMPNGEISAVSR